MKCFPNQKSKGELELRDFIRGLGFDILPNSREVLKNLEYDIWIPNARVAIEYNGIYWHSDEIRSDDYHVDKFIRSRDAGVRLIQIFEDEWINHKQIVKDRLHSILGRSTKIYARKCKIADIATQEYTNFVTSHHLQGYANATYKIGLYHDTTLVAVMSFSKSRYDKEGFEMIRYCSVGTVVGGASKLFSRFVKTVKPTKVFTYANRCWSDGNLYEKIGFKNITKNDRNIGYWYIKKFDRYHRSTFTKKRLVKMGYDATMTEQQIMKSAGYHRVTDCGNYKFEWVSPIQIQSS